VVSEYTKDSIEDDYEGQRFLLEMFLNEKAGPISSPALVL
jgi:hypothetical protein